MFGAEASCGEAAKNESSTAWSSISALRESCFDLGPRSTLMEVKMP